MHQFEIGWQQLMNDHDLDNNDWLGTLYEERKRWVPCYLKGNFWAGMSTTQRSEGFNVFFDGFINSTTMLQQFVVQYKNALYDKAEKECEVDFASLNTTIPCATQSFIERQYQQAYTHSKFAEIQMEFRTKMNCAIKMVDATPSGCNYVVLQELLWDGKSANKYYVIHYDAKTGTITCSCHLF